MIKAVVFDAGGVLVDWEDTLNDFFKKIEVDKKAWKKVTVDLFDLSQTGKIDLDEYTKRMMKILKREEYWEELRKIYPAGFKPIKESFELLEQLQGKFRLTMLVNSEKGVHDEWDKINDHKKYFEVIVDSSEVGLVKPDQEIYQLALDRLGLEARECLFIDDTLINVEAAEKLGFEVVYFKNPRESVKKIRHKLLLV